MVAELMIIESGVDGHQVGGQDLLSWRLMVIELRDDVFESRADCRRIRVVGC